MKSISPLTRRQKEALRDMCRVLGKLVEENQKDYNCAYCLEEHGKHLSHCGYLQADRSIAAYDKAFQGTLP